MSALPPTDQFANRRIAWIVTTVFAVAVVLNTISAVIAFDNNTARIHQIQQERVATVLRSCREQNLRHDATIHSLDELIRRLPPEKRTRAVQSRAGTVLLINALAPKRDCATLARATVPSH